MNQMAAGRLCCFILGIACYPESLAAAPLGSLLPGLDTAMNTKIVVGETIDIEAPPSNQRDADHEANSIQSVEATIGARRALPDGAYQTVRKNWIIEQNPDANLAEIVKLVRRRYTKVVLRHVPSPRLNRIEVEHFTLIYPAKYDGNELPVTVHTRRLKIHATDLFGDNRFLVAYYANYDKVDNERPAVLFQSNGHFGHNPSRLGFGLEKRGGYFGAVLGKIAMRGYPLLVYDDHDVGESSRATGKEPGLFRTLANMRMMDDALLVHFNRVDAFGLSGGCERLYHFLIFHRCRMPSAYLAGMYNSLWMPLDNRNRTGGPFGVNPDTFHVPFHEQFQWADLVLVGIAEGIDIGFVNMTYEGGSAKNCFQKELLPALRRFTNDFSSRGDDPDGDGISNTGKNFSHEYDIDDYLDFVRSSRR